MNTVEANIKISRVGKLTTVSVQMPIWTKESDYGNLIISLPLLGIETIAKDQDDTEKAIEEAITSFCKVADKFGQGIEKELLTLGWVHCKEDGEQILGYTLSDASETDAMLERLIQTGEDYVNPELKLETA